MPSKNQEFATYCCELLGSLGPCLLRRMFGGFGISRDGLTVALMTDLGEGEKLWLKADDETRAQFEAAGCQRFGYLREGVSRSMNYYSAPEEAMDSPQQMAPWARLAWQAALKASLKAASQAASKAASKANSKATSKAAVKVAGKVVGKVAGKATLKAKANVKTKLAVKARSTVPPKSTAKATASAPLKKGVTAAKPGN